MRVFVNGVEISDGSVIFQAPVRVKKPTAVPSMERWPLWAKALKIVAKRQDKGIGDVVARIIGEENSEAFKAWHLKTFGKACGCKGRQDRWNRMYPL